MVEVRTADSSEIGSHTLGVAERLVKSTFGQAFRPNDWCHGLGGTHVLVSHGGELLGHAAVVSRLISHSGNPFRTGYVEAVAVRPDHQGRGLGAVLMDATEAIVRAGYQVGALNAIDHAASFYAGRGWQLWSGQTGASTPDGEVVDTYDAADRIFLLPATDRTRYLDTRDALVCDWRHGDLW